MNPVLNNPEFILMFLSGTAAFLMQFATLIWRISKAESRIEARIHDVERDTDDKINKLRTEMLEGRVTAATTFLRKDSFNSMVTNIDSRLIRFEAKLDSAMNDFIRKTRGSKD